MEDQSIINMKREEKLTKEDILKYIKNPSNDINMEMWTTIFKTDEDLTVESLINYIKADMIMDVFNKLTQKENSFILSTDCSLLSSKEYFLHMSDRTPREAWLQIIEIQIGEIIIPLSQIRQIIAEYILTLDKSKTAHVQNILQNKIFSSGT